jgi:hypothetical protein
MADLVFQAPLRAGKCATPLAISATETEVRVPINGASVRTGTFQITLMSDVDWKYSDRFGSGDYIPVAAGQTLTIPLYDDVVIGAATQSGTGNLFAMIARM